MSALSRAIDLMNAVNASSQSVANVTANTLRDIAALLLVAADEIDSQGL